MYISDAKELCDALKKRMTFEDHDRMGMLNTFDNN